MISHEAMCVGPSVEVCGNLWEMMGLGMARLTNGW